MASRLKGILPRFVIFAAVGWAAGVHRRTKKLTRQDDLTGALNRRGFFEVLDDESKRSQRYLHPLTVVYVDLDDFKLVNDLKGHKTGNLVLQEVARTMQSILREVDFVARLGGDEFALLLPETGAENVRAVLEKLRTALMNKMNARDWRVTFQHRRSNDLPEFRPPPHRSTRMIGTHRQKARPKLPCARSSAANGLAQSREGLWRQASLCSRDIAYPSRRIVEGSASFWPRSQAILVSRNGPSPRRQDERQYNQPGQQHAREKRERRLQRVRLEMAASLC